MTLLNVEDQLRQAYLRAAYATIQEYERDIYRNRLFYSGEQGIQLTARQREYLGDIANELDDQALCNISRRAIEIPLERLAVEQIVTSGEGLSTFADMARQWWDANQLNAWQYFLYESALRDSASCIIVGWDGKQPTFTQNDLYDGINGNIRLHYSEDDGTLLFASKRYGAYDPIRLQLTGKTRLTLYFSDRIERYEDSTSEANGWRLLDEIEAGGPNPQPWVDANGQPLGLPVVVFDNPGMSELDSVLMPQKAINHALTDLLSAQDLHGFPLMALKGYKAQMGADGKPVAIKLAPGEAITMPTDGAAERIPGVDLAPMFDTGVMGWLQLCSIIKGWPLYLWARGDPPSGEALKVMESSLVSQVRRKQEGFKDSWLEAFTLGARLHELFNHQTLSGTIEFQWKDPETRNQLATIQTLAAKFDAGQIPLVQRWRELGYSDEEIQRMTAEQTQLAVNAAVQSIQGALMAQRQMTQLGGDVMQPQTLLGMNGNGEMGNGMVIGG